MVAQLVKAKCVMLLLPSVSRSRCRSFGSLSWSEQWIAVTKTVGSKEDQVRSFSLLICSCHSKTIISKPCCSVVVFLKLTHLPPTRAFLGFTVPPVCALPRLSGLSEQYQILVRSNIRIYSPFGNGALTIFLSNPSFFQATSIAMRWSVLARKFPPGS